MRSLGTMPGHSCPQTALIASHTPKHAPRWRFGSRVLAGLMVGHSCSRTPISYTNVLERWKTCERRPVIPYPRHVGGAKALAGLYQSSHLVTPEELTPSCSPSHSNAYHRVHFMKCMMLHCINSSLSTPRSVEDGSAN